MIRFSLNKNPEGLTDKDWVKLYEEFKYHKKFERDFLVDVFKTALKEVLHETGFIK